MAMAAEVHPGWFQIKQSPIPSPISTLPLAGLAKKGAAREGGDPQNRSSPGAMFCAWWSECGAFVHPSKLVGGGCWLISAQAYPPL